MISFEHVSRHYAPTRHAADTLKSVLAFRRATYHRPFTALDDVSFHLRQGEALGIVGGNGAGKSTLLKLLTRVISPSSGRIRVNGSLSSLLEVGSGFHTDLNGQENVYLAGAILGMSRREINRRISTIIAFSGLGSFMHTPVRTWSSGMSVRLAFSIGVHLDSDILVIDEALSVGDAEFQAQCMTKIQDFRGGGGTLVLVSHDDHQLSQVCSRGILLERGRLIYEGSIDSTLSYYHAQRYRLRDTGEK